MRDDVPAAFDLIVHFHVCKPAEEHYRASGVRAVIACADHVAPGNDDDGVAETLAAFEAKFGEFIPQMKWVNFGGGHHITRPGYDTDHLVRLIKAFRDRYGVAVYLEPGEAVALGTGVLVASVLDVFDNGMPIAILDTSATAHMPDVLEMPYRPVVVGAGAPSGVLVAGIASRSATTRGGIPAPLAT